MSYNKSELGTSLRAVSGKITATSFFKMLTKAGMSEDDLESFQTYLADEKEVYEEDYGNTRASAAYWLEILGDWEDTIDDEDDFDEYEAVRATYPDLKDANSKTIAGWYRAEGSIGDFDDIEDFKEFIADDFLDMFWAGSYDSKAFKDVAEDMIKCGYFEEDDFPYGEEDEELDESVKVGFNAIDNVSVEDSLNKMFQGSESVHMGFGKVEIRGPGAPIVYSAVLNANSLQGKFVKDVKTQLDEYENNVAAVLRRNEKDFAMYESADVRAHLIVENEEGFKYLIDQIGGDFSGANPEWYGDKIPNAFAHALTFEDWQFIRIDDGSFCEEDLLLSKEEFDTIFDSATKVYVQLQVQFEERRSEYSYEMYESKKRVQEAVPAGFLNELREVANALKMFVEDYTGNDYSDYLSRLLRGDITMGEFLDHMDEAVAFGDFGADYVDSDDGAMPAEAEEEYIDLRYDYCKVAELEF